METTSKFDLNQAMSGWRDSFAITTSIASNDLRELETHLTDSISKLQRAGLTEEDAFVIASRRLGNPTALANEFRSIDPHTIWVTRAIWILLSIQIFKLGNFLISIFGGVAQMAVAIYIRAQQGYGNEKTQMLVSTWVSLWFSTIAAWIIFPVILYILWRGISRKRINLHTLLMQARQRIWKVGITLCLVPIFLQILSLLVRFQVNRLTSSPASTFHLKYISPMMGLVLVNMLLIPFAIIWLLNRKELKTLSLETEPC
jgi:hypothetical protein